jgi:hypothetical protein
LEGRKRLKTLSKLGYHFEVPLIDLSPNLMTNINHFSSNRNEIRSISGTSKWYPNPVSVFKRFLHSKVSRPNFCVLLIHLASIVENAPKATTQYKLILILAQGVDPTLSFGQTIFEKCYLTI